MINFKPFWGINFSVQYIYISKDVNNNLYKMKNVIC